MGFSSMDDLINQITTNGKYLRKDTAKTTFPAHTAGGWHLTAGLSGNPGPLTFTGQDLVWQNLDEFTGEAGNVCGILHGGGLSGNATKHLLSIGANIIAAAGAPWQLKLVDLQGYYRISGANVTSLATRSLTNSNTFVASNTGGNMWLTYANDWKSGTKVQFTTSSDLPTGLSLTTQYYLVRDSATTARISDSYNNYVSANYVPFVNGGTGTHTLRVEMPRTDNGAGLQAFFVSAIAPSTGGPTVFSSSYTNPAGVTGRSFQGVPSFGAAADAYANRILHSGNAAGRYGPFLPLQGGDTGIESIQSFTLSAGTPYTGTGVLALCVCKPICDISVPVSGMWSERDLVNQLPSLPEIENGAFLTFLLFGTGASTSLSPITAALDFAWGG